jgi:hypothetical protein
MGEFWKELSSKEIWKLIALLAVGSSEECASGRRDRCLDDNDPSAFEKASGQKMRGSKRRRTSIEKAENRERRTVCRNTSREIPFEKAFPRRTVSQLPEVQGPQTRTTIWISGLFFRRGNRSDTEPIDHNRASVSGRKNKAKDAAIKNNNGPRVG